MEQETIPSLKKMTQDRFEELELKLKLNEIRGLRFGIPAHPSLNMCFIPL